MPVVGAVSCNKAGITFMGRRKRKWNSLVEIFVGGVGKEQVTGRLFSRGDNLVRMRGFDGFKGQHVWFCTHICCNNTPRTSVNTEDQQN